MWLANEHDTPRHAIDLCPQRVQISADGAKKVDHAGGGRGGGAEHCISHRLQSTALMLNPCRH